MVLQLMATASFCASARVVPSYKSIISSSTSIPEISLFIYTALRCDTIGRTPPRRYACSSSLALFNLKRARKELQAYILGGVLPIVSHRNAVYMNNEISGIEVDEEIVAMYEGTTRKEAQKLAVDISCKTMDEMRPYIDGYYLITPFNRVEIIADMITYIHKQ